MAPFADAARWIPACQVGPHPEHYSRDPELVGSGGSIAQWRMGEQILVQILLFVGACAWAYVTAKFVDVIANGEPALTVFRQDMDTLNRFCSYYGIKTEKRRLMRNFMQETFEVSAAFSSRAPLLTTAPSLLNSPPPLLSSSPQARKLNDCQRVFKMMPAHMIHDPEHGILFEVHGPWLTMMPFLRRPRRRDDPLGALSYLDNNFMMKLVTLLEPHILSSHSFSQRVKLLSPSRPFSPLVTPPGDAA